MPENESGDMRKLVEDIAKVLVDSPDTVSARADENDHGAVIELRVAPGDMGRVIGKQGRTARSMRNILGVAGMKFQKRYTLDIVE